MDDAGFEQLLTRLLEQDLSVGTGAFRDALLVRCLDELGSSCRGRTLADGDLELLAAAGDPASVRIPPFGDTTSHQV